MTGPLIGRAARDVLRTISVHALLTPGMRVAAAVSGGPDSLLLLHLLARLRNRLGIELHAVHVDHRLRPGSAGEGRLVGRAAATLGIPFHQLALPDGWQTAGRGSLELRARERRLAALKSVLAAEGLDRCATGHTLTDSVESVLMRLVSGSGLDGLTGIPYANPPFVRPLRDLSRERVTECVREAGIACAEDESNADPRFLRNRVRHRLLPLLREFNPAIEQAIDRLGRAAGAASGVVAAWVERLRTEGATEGSETGVKATSVALGVLAGLEPERRRLAIRGLLGHAFPERRIGAADVAEIEKLLLARGPEAVRAGRFPAARAGGRLLIGQVPAGNDTGPITEGELAGPGRIDLGGNGRIEAELLPGAVLPAGPDEACFDAGLLGWPLTIRGRRRGDRLRPLGLGGSRLLSDCLIDRKVDRTGRDRLPVVTWRGEIVWVPGVARGEIAPVTEGTETTLRLSYRPAGERPASSR